MCVPNPKLDTQTFNKIRGKGDTQSPTPQATTKVAESAPTSPFVATPESPTRSRRRSLIINMGRRSGSGLNVPL